MGTADGGRATVHRSCTLCEALCGLTVEVDVEANRVLSIVGDEDDPLSRGYLCPKGLANADLAHDPERLRTPVVRQPDGSFAPATWDEALDLVGDRLRAIRAEHGRDAVASYVGNPTAHNTGALFVLPVLEALRSRNRYSATSTDQAPQALVSYLLFGHQLLFPLPDLDRTDHLLILGANPAVSNGSLVTAPDFRGRIRGVRERGGRVVVVDPRRTETARLADEHVAVRPGTDTALLAAMVHTLFDEDLVDLGRLAGFTDGVDEVRAAVTAWTPEVAAPVCGVDADTIRRMARELAAAGTAVAYSRVGTCQTRNGSVTSWLVVLLNVLTGNLDEPGGAMFASPAVDLHRLVALLFGPGSYDQHRSRVRDLPEVNGELPVATLADEITTPGEGRVRALVVWAGNPVLSAPNGAKLERALPELDLLVAVDPYVTETSRHADVILPPTVAFEREHYDVVFHALAVRNTAQLSPAALRPHPDARHDHEIAVELGRRVLGGRLNPVVRTVGSLARHLDPLHVVEGALRLGQHGLRRGRDGLSLRRLRAEPHGVDLGPLQRTLPGRLWHRDGRIRLAPAVLLEGLVAAADDLLSRDPEPGDGSLQLVGRRHLRSNNSWLHNSERLVKGRDRCTALLHPDDAAARGVEDGDPVRVTSRVGSVVVPAEVSDEVRPGVVAVPHGWGHDRPGVSWTTAAANPGASVNDVTDDEVLERLTGNAAYNDVRVTVAAEPAAADGAAARTTAGAAS